MCRKIEASDVKKEYQTEAGLKIGYILYISSVENVAVYLLSVA